MAADLGLLSSSQHQKLALTQAQQQSNPSLSISSSWMWNPRQAQEDDDSWEVRAFAEDTGNIMGTTWPPRSYSCTFCRREFRSAQALGGHMNVHRRDRARLRQSPPVGDSAASPASSSALIFPAQDFVSNGTGLCLLYTLPSPSDSTHVFNSIPMNGCTDDSPSSTTLLSVSPFPTNDYFMPSNCSPLNFPVAASVHGSSIYQCSSKVESTYKYIADDDNNKNIKESIIEELDLELRLGSRSSP